MKRIVGTAILAIALSACSGAPEAEPAPSDAVAEAPAPTASADEALTDTAVFFCGGETTRGQAASFFTDLDAALANSDADATFDALATPQLTVIENGEASNHDNSALTPALVSREDWEAIAQRGMAGLESVGYRGCMLDSGKVWLEAAEGGELKLKSINRDMEWIASDAAG